MFGIGEALSIAGLAASAFGGGKKKKGEAPAQSGFAALPDKVQKAWLDTYLPDVLAMYGQPRRQLPMMRAQSPVDAPFASQGLWDLQKYSDSMYARDGSSLFGGPAQPVAAAASPQASGGISPDMMKEIEGMMMASQGSRSYGPTLRRGMTMSQYKDPDTGGALQKFYGLTPDQRQAIILGIGGNKFTERYGFNPYANA